VAGPAGFFPVAPELIATTTQGNDPLDAFIRSSRSGECTAMPFDPTAPAEPLTEEPHVEPPGNRRERRELTRDMTITQIMVDHAERTTAANNRL
jgi:hypothetical protein